MSNSELEKPVSASCPWYVEEVPDSRRTLGTREVPTQPLGELRQKLFVGWVSLLFSREAFIQQTFIRERVCTKHHAQCGDTRGDTARSLVRGLTRKTA